MTNRTRSITTTKATKRPQSASRAQAGPKRGGAGDRVLRARPNSASTKTPLARKALGDNLVAAEPKRSRDAWVEEPAPEFSYDGFLEQLEAGEESEGEELVDTTCSGDIPMERFMKINNLTVEELEYLKTVLD